MKTRIKNTHELTSRQKEILNHLIKHYISSKEPVGSKTIAEHYLNTLSPATIRNTMEEIEEMGYLYKPHTSAGRIPTEKSFKYFVSEILKNLNEKDREIELLQAEIDALKNEKDEIFSYITKMLAELSHQTAIMLLPQFNYSKVKALDFFKLSSNKILAVIILQPAFVEHKVIEIEEEFTQSQLSEYARYINNLLEKNLSLSEIREIFLTEMKQLKDLFDRMLERLELGVYKKSVIVEGQSNLLDTPEFSDVAEMKRIFKVFEEKGKILSLLDNSLKVGGIKIFIGSDLCEELENAAMVTVPYTDGSNKIGTLGVLGPMRMDYARILSLVISAANILSRSLKTV